MLVKDEADIVETTVRHLLGQVDEVIVADNLSTDGTYDRLLELAGAEDRLIVRIDEERGYYQAEKTTRLALEALDRGHRWVIPCDADELWLAPDGRPIRDWLDGLGREVQFVKAAIYNHVATALDSPASCSACGTQGLLRVGAGGGLVDLGPHAGGLRDPCPLCKGRVEPNPVARIRWRQRTHLEMRWGKVACRLRPDLRIHQGNHSAATSGTGTTAFGLELRHFPYRSAEHFVRKAVNGYAAYQATDLDEGIGSHWRVYGRAIEEGGETAGHEWFYDAFWSSDPKADDSLVYDPVLQPRPFIDDLTEAMAQPIGHRPGCDVRGTTTFCARDCPHYNG